MSELNNCLISELSKLKESSKEAVENTESFNDFKKYMHINRKVEGELKHIVEQVLGSSKKQLILVCGSVGDGKSHLLSYLKSQMPEIEKQFYIHNDATESKAPDKTSMDTLCEVLSGFSDEKLNENVEKENILLAINLGTLNNFLHSKYSDNFCYLKEYVESNYILEARIQDNNFDESSHFQHVNLSDYQLFSLTENGPRSTYIQAALQKVTNQTEENPFYKTYLKYCIEQCPVASQCPIRSNYELLMRTKVQEEIIHFIAELTLKYKPIISSRTLFNFIYNILVATEFEQKNTNQELHQYIQSMSTSQHLEVLLPNLFFDFSNVSDVFKSLYRLDPINKRSETLDTLTITFYNSQDIYSIFKACIHESALELLSLTDILQFVKGKEKTIALQTLLRLYAFIPNEGETKLDIYDQIYNSYVSNLYHWNKGNLSDLRELYYEVVIKSIYEWNGKSDNGRININPGRNQLKYAISQDVEIKPDVDELSEREDLILEKFLPYMNLKFRIKGKDTPGYEIRIDYPLYSLLMQIKDGYRPNQQDKNNFINFVDFVNRIIESGESQQVTISEKVGKDLRKYELIYDEDFKEFQFKER